MKKLLLILAVSFLIGGSLSSCNTGKETCPAYSGVDTEQVSAENES